MLFRQKSTKWDKLLVFFIVLVNANAYLIGMSFFHVLVRFLHCIFYIAVLLKRLQFCSKSELTTNGEELDILCSIVLRFVVAISEWTEISKKCSLLFRLRGHQVFSVINLRYVPVCSLNVLILFSHRIFWYPLKSFINAIYLYFQWLCFLLFFFL